MSLVSRVSDLATAIGNYLRDSVTPRLIPPGGTQGAVLTKSSSTNYEVTWSAGSTSPVVSAAASRFAQGNFGGM